ncbi:MAG: YaeQ family protein [Pseudobdellovibrio sp.]
MLYRFNIELSNIDREVYETLDFRVSQHPSEIASYLLTRTLAYALSYREGLEFSAQGLADPDSPALQLMGRHNSIDLWIEIGNASSRKLHKATKSAKEVQVYTYKNPEVLINDMKANEVHKAEEIKIFAFDEKFISALEKILEKNNRWSLVIQQNQISVSVGEQSIVTEMKELQAN